MRAQLPTADCGENIGILNYSLLAFIHFILAFTQSTQLTPQIANQSSALMAISARFHWSYVHPSKVVGWIFEIAQLGSATQEWATLFQ